MPRLTGRELVYVLDCSTETDLESTPDRPLIGNADPAARWQHHADRRTCRRTRRATSGIDRDHDDAEESANAWQPKRRQREDGRETFRCRHCQAMIGPTVSGGRHRNHCPLCLYSRHVDDRRPGDRASPCRSLMAPIGTCFRPKGEQVVVHRCLGCGLERFNRVAADDNALALLRLPLVPPRTARRGAVTIAETAADERPLEEAG